MISKISTNIEPGHIEIMQFASPIRRPKIQREYLKSLGLGKINRKRILKDSLAIRGLLVKVRHLVKVIAE